MRRYAMYLNQKGLTLVELLAVIVILAIVAAIAIPSIGNIIDNSRGRALKAEAVNTFQAARLYVTENTPEQLVSTTLTLNDLKLSGHLSNLGGLTSAEITFDTDGKQTIEASGEKGQIILEIEAGTTYEQLLEHEGKPVNGIVSIP